MIAIRTNKRELEVVAVKRRLDEIPIRAVVAEK